MNSPLVNPRSQVADRYRIEDRKPDKRRVEEIYLRVLRPSSRRHRNRYGTRLYEHFRSKWTRYDEENAWTSLTHALMASNEFIFVY